jgi:hypothetical protein
VPVLEEIKYKNAQAVLKVAVGVINTKQLWM